MSKVRFKSSLLALSVALLAPDRAHAADIPLRSRRQPAARAQRHQRRHIRCRERSRAIFFEVVVRLSLGGYRIDSFGGRR